MDDPVGNLLHALEGRHDLLTSRPADVRQLAAGGLMRTEALLRGVRLFIEVGRADLVGLLVRAIWECWVLSLYLLLGGEAACDHVMANYRHHVETYWKNWPEDAGPPPILDDDYWKDFPPPRTLRFDLVAKSVEKLLRGADVGPIAYSGISSYDVLYRLESTFSAHAGKALFDRYVAYGFDVRPYDGVVASPKLVVPDEQLEAMAAVWVAHLAWFVYREFGISTVAIEAPFLALISEAKMIRH